MFYFLVLFINLFPAPLQESKTFELISTESGLSNNIVFDVYQDRKGFIWIATDNGLNRYDGYHFKKFYHNPLDSSSLSSNIIRKVLEDKAGNLWIGTKNGLNLYDRENETFKKYLLEESSEQVSMDTQEMELDKYGRIWFNNLRLFGYFDTKTKHFKILDADFYCHSLTLDKDRTIWVNSKWGELGNIDVDSLRLKRLNNEKKPFEGQIHFGKYSNSLWIDRILSDHRFNVNVKILPELPKGIKPTKLKEIDNRILLIGTKEGLFEYDYQEKILKRVKLSASVSALTKQIRSIYKDNNGGIWIGTLGGVFHYDDFKHDFVHISLNKDEEDVVMGIKAGENGIYANALGKGIYYKANHSTIFNRVNTNNVLFGEELFIWGIEEVPKSSYPIWLSTNNGLICYDPINNRKRKITLPVIDAGIEISFDIHNTAKDYVWVASMGAVQKVDKKNAVPIANYLLNNGKNRSTVQKIIEFDNDLILATESDGLFRLDQNTGITSFIKLKENSEGRALTFKTYIWDLHVFNNVLWIGTNRGLFSLRKGEVLATPIFNDNQIIFSIANDGNDHLWMGTERGLMSFNTKTNANHRYGAIDGLKNIEFNRRSVAKTEDGRLWFGGVHGITVFDPSKIQENTIIPPVHITKLRAITADSVFRIPLRNKKVVIPHKQNTIELDYVALNYTNSSQNSYKHQLIGYDPNWVQNQTRKARYVQLPTGKYTFKVIAANNDGLWNKRGDEIEIQILPPFWETWWFRSLLVLVGLTIIYTLYSYRVKRLLQIERMKLRIASDLHDEVGSGLSGIALTSDVLEQQIGQGEIKPHLASRITKSARQLASTLDDIVWLINPEKETIDDFIIKSKAIAQELLPNAHVVFIDDVSEVFKKKIVRSEHKRNLLLFVKEAINNVAKHAEAKNVSIRFEYIEQIIKIEISDDGRGFELNEKTRGSGIISMKNRAKELDGKLHLFSEINEGTQIILIVKIP